MATATTRNTSVYEKSDVFTKECKPLLDRLILLGNIYRIPMFFSAAVSNDTDGTEYYSDGVFPEGRPLKLTDDRITKHLAVVCGFDTVPERTEFELDMDAFDGSDLDEFPDDALKDFT